MFLKKIGQGLGNVVTTTTGAVGSVAGGVVAGTGGLVCGTFKGDPLGGLQRGIDDGVRVGGAVGSGVGGITTGAVGALAKGSYVVANVTLHIAETGVLAVTRGVESFARGQFHECDNTTATHVSAFLSGLVYSTSLSSMRDVAINVQGGEVVVNLLSCCPQNNLKVALFQVVQVSSSHHDRSLQAGDLILAFKGTDLSKAGKTAMRDCILDLGILAGVLGSSMNVAKSLGEDQIWKCPDLLKRTYGYGAQRFYVTGHSLGGAAAIVYAAHVDNFEHVTACHTFNPGTGLFQNDCDAMNAGDNFRDFAPIRAGLRGLALLSESEVKLIVHHTYLDPVSTLSRGGDSMAVITYQPYGNLNPHTFQQFTSGNMDTVLKSQGAL